MSFKPSNSVYYNIIEVGPTQVAKYIMYKSY